MAVPASALRPAAFSRPWELGTPGEEYLATVVVDAAQAPWAVRHVGAAAVAATRFDGAVELSLTVRNTPALLNFVLGFLDHAELLSPPAVRAELVAWIRAAALRGSNVVPT